MDTSIYSLEIKVIKKEAFRLGFQGFGITDPNIPEAADRFRQWLGEGYDAEMHYMKRGENKRVDLNLILPGVKSVICLRSDYLTVTKSMDFAKESNIGDVSLYALNEDYHDVIKPKLKVLDQKIHELIPGCATKVYTDTGPILEKPLAQKAGLGWIGKHTNLITEHAGSWYFLSEILVDVDLPVSQPAIDHCGTCRDCIDICPTNAIVAPYILDARKCISYLTIELKDIIPLEFRKPIGNRIYGCDDCQIVCPWNSFAQVVEEAAYQEKPDTRQLIDLMQINEESFRKRFRKSPIKRLKRRGLLRNVAVALGNSGNSEAVPVLIKALKDSEPLIRAHTVWALGELLGKKTPAILEEHLKSEQEESVLKEIRRVQTVYLKN